MLHSKLSRLSSAPLSSEPVACFAKKRPQWHSRQPPHPKLTDMTGANSEEDGTLKISFDSQLLYNAVLEMYGPFSLTKITVCVCVCVINHDF